MTKQERKLWYEFLKSLGITFNRQKVIGSYIVDFYCSKAKIVIELDGSQHFSEENALVDRARDEYLKQQGIKVLRYNNVEVDQNFRGVCDAILQELAKCHLTTVYDGASPQGEA